MLTQHSRHNWTFLLTSSLSLSYIASHKPTGYQGCHHLQASAMSKQWVMWQLENTTSMMKHLTRCRLTAWISSPSFWKRIQRSVWQRTMHWSTDGWRRSHNTTRQARNLQVHHSHSKLFTKWVFCCRFFSSLVHCAQAEAKKVRANWGGDCVAAPVTLPLATWHYHHREHNGA